MYSYGEWLPRYIFTFYLGDNLNVWKATFLQYSEKLSETVKKQSTIIWVTYSNDAIIFKQLQSPVFFWFKIHFNENNYTLQLKCLYCFYTEKSNSSIYIDSRGSNKCSLPHMCYFQNHLLLTWNIKMLTLVKLFHKWIVINITYLNIINISIFHVPYITLFFYNSTGLNKYLCL